MQLVTACILLLWFLLEFLPLSKRAWQMNRYDTLHQLLPRWNETRLAIADILGCLAVMCCLGALTVSTAPSHEKNEWLSMQLMWTALVFSTLTPWKTPHLSWQGFVHQPVQETNHVAVAIQEIELKEEFRKEEDEEEEEDISNTGVHASALLSEDLKSHLMNRRRTGEFTWPMLSHVKLAPASGIFLPLFDGFSQWNTALTPYELMLFLSETDLVARFPDAPFRSCLFQLRDIVQEWAHSNPLELTFDPVKDIGTILAQRMNTLQVSICDQETRRHLAATLKMTLGNAKREPSIATLLSFFRERLYLARWMDIPYFEKEFESMETEARNYIGLMLHYIMCIKTHGAHKAAQESKVRKCLEAADLLTYVSRMDMRANELRAPEDPSNLTNQVFVAYSWNHYGCYADPAFALTHRLQIKAADGLEIGSDEEAEDVDIVEEDQRQQQIEEEDVLNKITDQEEEHGEDGVEDLLSTDRKEMKLMLSMMGGAFLGLAPRYTRISSVDEQQKQQQQQQQESDTPFVLVRKQSKSVLECLARARKETKSADWLMHWKGDKRRLSLLRSVLLHVDTYRTIRLVDLVDQLSARTSLQDDLPTELHWQKQAQRFLSTKTWAAFEQASGNVERVQHLMGLPYTLPEAESAGTQRLARFATEKKTNLASMLASLSGVRVYSPLTMAESEELLLDLLVLLDCACRWTRMNTVDLSVCMSLWITETPLFHTLVRRAMADRATSLGLPPSDMDDFRVDDVVVCLLVKHTPLFLGSKPEQTVSEWILTGVRYAWAHACKGANWSTFAFDDWMYQAPHKAAIAQLVARLLEMGKHVFPTLLLWPCISTKVSLSRRSAATTKHKSVSTKTFFATLEPELMQRTEDKTEINQRIRYDQRRTVQILFLFSIAFLHHCETGQRMHTFLRWALSPTFCDTIFDKL